MSKQRGDKLYWEWIRENFGFSRVDRFSWKIETQQGSHTLFTSSRGWVYSVGKGILGICIFPKWSTLHFGKIQFETLILTPYFYNLKPAR